MTNDEKTNKLETISKEIHEIAKTLKGKLDNPPRTEALGENDFLLHEYDSLREEIVQRTTVRFTIITITMTAFAAVFAFSATSIGVYLMMLYPGLSFFFLASYIANSYGIRKLEKYIKDVIENKVREDNQEPDTSKIGWHHRKPGGYIRYLKLSLSYLVSNLLFPASSLIAWIVAFIIIFTTKVSTLSNNGINLTYVALWLSFATILVSIFLALFEGRLFSVEKDF